MPKDLRSYMDELRRKAARRMLVVVDREVDPRYEASAIVEKFERENKFPLVFFKNSSGQRSRSLSISARLMNDSRWPWDCPPFRKWSRICPNATPSGTGQRDFAKDAPGQGSHSERSRRRSGPASSTDAQRRGCGSYINAAALICKERGTSAVNVGIAATRSRGSGSSD